MSRQTNSRTYPSKYTSRRVTAAQYISELVCENIAKKQNKQLPVQFWQSKDWDKVFRRQTQLAYGLLRIYSEESLIKVINATPWLLSLGAKFIDKAIEEAESRNIIKPSEIRLADTNGKPIQPLPTKSLKDIL